MDKDSTVKKVYQHPNLTKAQICTICDMHELFKYKKGDFILTEGEVASGYCCLEKGLARSFVRSNEGKIVTTGFFTQYDIVIEVASLFRNLPSKESIEALTDCICWHISLDSFQSLFEKMAGFSEWGRDWMTEQLLLNKQRSLSIITDSATERYLQLQSEQPEVIKKAPLKHIASYLGITDTSLSRIRKELAGY